MWPFKKKNPIGEVQPPSSPYVVPPWMDNQQPRIEVELDPDRSPEFERRYTVDVSGRSMLIKIRCSCYCGMMYSGELTQVNGRWVLFDPEHVADKILDPALVPIIEARIAEIIFMDKAFRASNPSEFVDEKGQKWRKV